MTTATANKIVRSVNAARHMGGFIVANVNDGLATWYSDASRPAIGVGEVSISVRSGKFTRARLAEYV